MMHLVWLGVDQSQLGVGACIVKFCTLHHYSCEWQWGSHIFHGAMCMSTVLMRVALLPIVMGPS